MNNDKLERVGNLTYDDGTPVYGVKTSENTYNLGSCNYTIYKCPECDKRYLEDFEICDSCGWDSYCPWTRLLINLWRKIINA